LITLPPRITLSRAKGWRLQDVAPGAVKVDRGGTGLWGNPWIVGNPGRFCSDLATLDLPVNINEATARAMFRDWIEQGHIYPNGLPADLTRKGRTMAEIHLIKRRAAILAALHTLRGKPLACWCKPGCPCHADVLLRLANA
jgi:hypothetical protein